MPGPTRLAHISALIVSLAFLPLAPAETPASAPATAPTPALAPLTVDAVVQALRASEQRLHNVQTEDAEVKFYEKIGGGPWKTTPEGISGSVWMSVPAGGKIRAEIIHETLQRVGGAAPYSEMSGYSAGWDGNVGTLVELTPTVQAHATLLAFRPKRLNDPYVTVLSGVPYSIYGYGRGETYLLLSDVISRISSAKNVLVTVARVQSVAGEHVVITAAQRAGHIQEIYTLDPQRGYALLGNVVELKRDLNDPLTIQRELTVQKLVEAAPGVWLPADATLDTRKDKTTMERRAFHAKEVRANQQWDEGIYRAAVLPGDEVVDLTKSGTSTTHRSSKTHSADD